LHITNKFIFVTFFYLYRLYKHIFCDENSFQRYGSACERARTASGQLSRTPGSRTTTTAFDGSGSRWYVCFFVEDSQINAVNISVKNSEHAMNFLVATQVCAKVDQKKLLEEGVAILLMTVPGRASLKSEAWLAFKKYMDR